MPIVLINILIALLTLGCGKSRTAQTVALSEDITYLAALTTQRIEIEREERGRNQVWLADGDWLIFAGLTCSSDGYGDCPEILQARDKDGKFHRNIFHSCTEAMADAGECTQISRDQYLGAFWYFWRTKDRTALEGIASYGRANDWVMGAPFPGDGRTFFTPNMRAILYQMIYALGGSDDPNRAWPILNSPGQVGYEAHLQVLSVLLIGEVKETLAEQGKPLTYGGSLSLEVTDGAYTRLAEHAAREPNNALFCAAEAIYSDTAKVGRCIALLTDEKHWPRGRLPHPTTEHCEFWLYQRDEKPHDWLPCDKQEPVSFGSAIFAADKILRRVK